MQLPNQRAIVAESGPDVKAKLLATGLYAAPSTPAQFDAHIRAETARYAKIVKEAGIKAD
jgi:tripartite-type tricarboxylate transporter receptor subunit TctC